MFGRIYGKGPGAGVGGQFDRSEGERRKAETAAVANDFDAVFEHVGGEIPCARAERARCEGEAGSDCILGSLSSRIGGVSQSLFLAFSPISGDLTGKTLCV